MKRIQIFKPCELNYKEYDKPVRFTEEFLKEIANSTYKVPLVNKHYGATLADVSNLSFDNNTLEVDVPEEFSKSKYSPSFDNLTLTDEGEYYLATGGYLVEVATNVKPRLDNGEDGGSNMADNDKTNEFLAKEVERLNKEIAKKDLKLDANKEKLEKFDEMDKELQELREWKETNSKVIEEQKPIIEKYNAYQEKHREELLEKASKGNKEVKEKLQNLRTEDLETIISLEVEEQPARGAGAGNAPGLNEGSGEKDKEQAEQKARKEAVEGMFGDLFKEE